MDNLYALLVMSAAASGLYVLLRLSRRWTHRYFRATWHYYTHVLLYSFFLLPYFKLVPLLGLQLPHVQPISLGTLAPGGSPAAAGYAAFAFLDLLPYLAAMGSAVFLAVILVQNSRLHRRVFSLCEIADDPEIARALAACRKELGIAKNIPVYLSPYTSTPFLCGIFRPKIVLPAALDFTPGEYRHVLLHEMTHYKRRDLWLKCLLVCINALHWFNPLAYWARRDVDRYCELSCDEKLVQSMDSTERKRYCELLLTVLWTAADQRVRMYSAFSSERKYLEGRIRMILNSQHVTKKRAVCAVATTLVLAVIGTASAYAASGGVSQDAGAPPRELPEGAGVISVQYPDGTVKSYDRAGNEGPPQAKEHAVPQPIDAATQQQIEEVLSEIRAYNEQGLPAPQAHLDKLNELYGIKPYATK